MPVERASVTRRVAAPAAALFAIVADPAGHVAIDGSGMLEAAPDARPLTAVGDTFAIAMDREPLGDLPIGKYQVRNTVTRLEPDRLVEWTVGNADRASFGYAWGWELTPVSDTETDVTNYFDWSGLSEERKAAAMLPLIPVTTIERSVENLERFATSD
ncbi:MAG TPA: SRPBCC family protein [Acidimicrobiia bacterium]|nr:SRPBCC family protein [Acidimicrobiia bacterium]